MRVHRYFAFLTARRAASSANAADGDRQQSSNKALAEMWKGLSESERFLYVRAHRLDLARADAEKGLWLRQRRWVTRLRPAQLNVALELVANTGSWRDEAVRCWLKRGIGRQAESQESEKLSRDLFEKTALASRCDG
eukprot:CAMPEP_0185751196 /NCGR_PEP_ID=MMETSP1174-20130828/9958_1 /TAXON_ID=35687 /ORGANISM="Dictyocha speculum, Strain CCMP1381" /LENGTH=136 /DNA_ID=CAMNT_0028428059 /DNA_START=35 /DNA_END=445 /DNA_ORIENTATION=+